MRWNRITFGDITVLSKTTFNLYKTVLCVLALAAALLLAGCGGADALFGQKPMRRYRRHYSILPVIPPVWWMDITTLQLPMVKNLSFL